jgi:LuxR family maltose regulon positive regulatory protein
MVAFQDPHTTQAAMLLALGDTESLAEARELLSVLRTAVNRRYTTRYHIEVLALEAHALALAGEEEDALALLERAVQLTVPGNAIRVLADLDFLIGSLLATLAPKSHHRGQIARIRRAAVILGTSSAASSHNAPEGSTQTPDRAAARAPERVQSLDELLTNRELEVLILLLDRMSNKEIAQKLTITDGTVKRHVIHIFRKLNVRNRRQAAAEAHRLGILTPK